MKKSTLITTIAMIVVVVVALSTATYAWFTSSSTAVATTTFSTTAAGEWSMIIGAYNKADDSLTFTTAAVDSANLAATGLTNGLWSPTAEIETTISSLDATTTLVDPASFVEGKKKGNDTILTGLLTPAFDSKAQGGAAAGNGKVAPFAMRLINTSGAQRALDLFITVNAGQTGVTNNSLYGAAAVKFYVYEFSNVGENGTGVAYNLAYQPSTEGTNFANQETLETITTIQTAQSVDRTITADTQVEKSATLANITSLPNYRAADITSQFTTAVDDAALGTAAGDKIIQYQVPMQTYGIGGYANVVIYVWIDGWVADNSAGDAHFSINFGFKSGTRG